MERELHTEYNRLKNEAHQKARDFIIRCAFILGELSYPISDVAAKLTEDLPFSKSYIHEVLPEKYKRGYQMSANGHSEPPTLESPLLFAIHSVVKTADLLKEVCNNLPKKLMDDKDKLTAMQSKINNDVVEQL